MTSTCIYIISNKLNITLYTALQKFRNALEKWGFGQYQHKSLSFFGANTLKQLDIIIEDQQ